MGHAQSTFSDVPADAHTEAFKFADDGLTTITGLTAYGKTLERLQMPDSVTTIGNYAFMSAKFHTLVLSKGLETISKYAFQSSALTKVMIPASVSNIGEGAFSGCSKLDEVVLLDDCSLSQIGCKVFDKCSGLTDIRIPSSVREIGDSAFRGCLELTEVSVPPSVKTIGPMAFSLCVKLRRVHLSQGLESIGQSAFKFCGMTGITIPESVTEIAESAFIGCLSLRQVITSIDRNAQISAGLCKKQREPSFVVEVDDEMVPEPTVLAPVNDGPNAIRFELPGGPYFFLNPDRFDDAHSASVGIAAHCVELFREVVFMTLLVAHRRDQQAQASEEALQPGEVSEVLPPEIWLYMLEFLHDAPQTNKSGASNRMSTIALFENLNHWKRKASAISDVASVPNASASGIVLTP